jgi:RNA polymerase sigma-70 factor, ECF subfamily
MWYPGVKLSDSFVAGDAATVDPIIVQLREGRSEALVLIYRQHQHAVRAFARRLLGVDADAEELVQDTFVQLPRVVGKFRGESALRTYILGITANLSRNYLRSRRRREALLERSANREEGLHSSSSGRAAVERLFLAAQLMTAMEQLSTQQRLAFVLLEVEERTSFEAGEILGIPPSTVRARANSARKKLQELLEGVRHEG